MINWQDPAQSLREFINAVIRFSKTRRREQGFLGIAAILFWLSYSFFDWLPTGIQDFAQQWNGKTIISSILFFAGVGFFGYAAYLLWKLVYTPELPPPANRPSAIKGPLAFTQADGALFRKLGREDELRKLLGFIQDDQTRLVVLMGASGVGKTSLLRAGLTDIIKDTEIKYHYWEVVPTDSGQSLLSAFNRSLDSKPEKPEADGEKQSVVKIESLDELINPKPGFGQHVIVLDQFEQLSNNFEDEIFKLLRKVCRESKPPYQVVWIITFRREYRASWSDFMIPEHERGFYPAESSLQLFPADQARDVISQLLKETDMQIEEKVVESLITAATIDGRVSSVDIGIGLQVLAELHSQKSSGTLTVEDYHFAGGAEGLLTQYISRCLEPFSEEDRKTLLNAMLSLRNAETNQRIGEGKTFDEIAKEVKAANARLLKVQLERLTQRDIRLLEQITVAQDDEPVVKYRLPHERLIPALNRLAGTLIGEIAEVKVKFGSAYSAWKSNSSSQYLLKGKTLRQVERFKNQLAWNADKDKQVFLQHSQRNRLIRRFASLGLIVILILGGFLGYKQYKEYRANQEKDRANLEAYKFSQLGEDERSAKNLLRQNNYPVELYDYQKQLKTLELKTGLNLNDLGFLRSDSLEELSLKATYSTISLQGLETVAKQCPNLKNLKLDLTGSQVKDLEVLKSLPKLTQLKLDLKGSKVEDLEVIKSLLNLTQLNLDLTNSYDNFAIKRGQEKDLEILKSLPNLTQLSLNLDSIEGKSADVLKSLLKLNQLELTLDYFQPEDVAVLKSLPKLTQLNLLLRESPVTDLEFLKNFPNLTQLNLDLSNSEVKDIKGLKYLPNLTQLDLYLGFSKVNDIEVLKKLPNLTHLTLHLSESQVILSEKFFDGFPNLTQYKLDLYFSEEKDFEVLKGFPKLNQLSLTLPFGPESGIEVLKNLTNLTQLNLYLGFSEVNDVKSLKSLPNLTQLSLNLDRSQVKDLDILQSLNLQKLELTLNTEQRLSLKTIPKSVTSLSF